MPITLPPINRRNFIKGWLALGSSIITHSDSLALRSDLSLGMDPNRVALLADTHISDDPKRSYPGTKWPGSPVKEEEHEWVNMADSLAQSAREVIGLNPRPAKLIINGDCAMSRGTEAEYKELLRLLEPIRAAGITVHITIGNHDNRDKLWKLLPFLKKEQMDQMITQAMNNQKYSNVNFLPRLKTNSEVNDLINSIDIDISGLSNGEGWNLPAFNATALGKWSIVSNCSSHKDWATKDNAILVEPVGKQPCYDNAFFVKGSKYNQGEYYRLHQDGISNGLDQSVQFAKSENTEGLKLQQEFTYAKTAEKILEKIY